jgi:hypothetical protein
MTLFSPAVLYRRIAMRDRRISSDIDFGVWASVVLIGLAFPATQSALGRTQSAGGGGAIIR